MVDAMKTEHTSPDDKCSDALVGIETFIVSDLDVDLMRRHATQQKQNRMANAGNKKYIRFLSRKCGIEMTTKNEIPR